MNNIGDLLKKGKYSGFFSVKGNNVSLCNLRNRGIEEGLQLSLLGLNR